MLDEIRPPTIKDRLLHPLSIAAMVLVVLVGGFWAHRAWQAAERARVQQAIAPLRVEWERIQADAPPRLARVQEVLAAAPAPAEQRCESLAGPVEVVHRPVLEQLAAGERNPRPDAPHWLSSRTYRYLAGMLTPSLDEQQYRERNEVVAAALARACVAVVETELAEDARMEDGRAFVGGGVLGWLRVVCPDEQRIACQARVASHAAFAVVVQQSDVSAQAGADGLAIDDSAASAYWQAVKLALAKVAPELVVERG